jgi:hypothetical protein
MPKQIGKDVMYIMELVWKGFKINTKLKECSDKSGCLDPDMKKFMDTKKAETLKLLESLGKTKTEAAKIKIRDKIVSKSKEIDEYTKAFKGTDKFAKQYKCQLNKCKRHIEATVSYIDELLSFSKSLFKGEDLKTVTSLQKKVKDLQSHIDDPKRFVVMQNDFAKFPALLEKL